MKIFNLEPIIVNRYLFNEEHAVNSLINFGFESGFSFTGKLVESLKTMIVDYNIFYTVGGQDKSYSLLSKSNPNQYETYIDLEDGNDIFFSFNSSCKFSFESENYELDLQSIGNFLEEYNSHTRAFLINNGFSKILEVEKNVRINHTLETDILLAIDCLRTNNMYDF